MYNNNNIYLFIQILVLWDFHNNDEILYYHRDQKKKICQDTQGFNVEAAVLYHCCSNKVYVSLDVIYLDIYNNNNNNNNMICELKKESYNIHYTS